jgi:conjugal transfer/entry exclusion protein
MRGKAKKILSAAVLVLVVAGTVSAGIPVFDYTNWVLGFERLLELQRQYQQIKLQYEHLKRMAETVPVDMWNIYHVPKSIWRRLEVEDPFGVTSGWTRAANEAASVLQGYREAGYALKRYGAGLSQVTSEVQQRAKVDYGNVALVDGSNVAGLELIGYLRLMARARESALDRLERDTLSKDPAMNTEIAVLNKLGASALMQLRAAQETNQLLASVLERQIVDSKRRRDADAAEINARIEFHERARDVLERLTGGTTSALAGYRLP